MKIAFICKGKDLTKILKEVIEKRTSRPIKSN